MLCKLIQVAENFWNIRGSFKIGGIIDVGTQTSLVQLANGQFVFLDAYTLNDEVADEVAALTDGGSKIEAIINLHPFHTLHVGAMHQRYPDAKLYGTRRHLELMPDLPWQNELSESPELQARYGQDLAFSIPAGVDFISTNPKLHCSSILAYHHASQTIHVDDTLMNIRLPRPMRLLGQRDALSFHPTLAKTLERRAGAAQEFRNWTTQLANDWRGAKNLCAAHTAPLLFAENNGPAISERIMLALSKVERTLSKHESKYG